MLVILLAVVAVMDVIVFYKLAITFRRLRPGHYGDKIDRDALPTVSVCISARNETHAMTQSLEHVIASDYPKLEVIVLDDGSRDNTSMLIKSFAHAGVRFIEGKPLPEGWLGKNYAQSVLAREASGKLILFLDVDTLIETRTITRLVQYYEHYQSTMVSVVPVRNDHWASSTLFATMRHFWAVLRFTPRKPRGAANAWLVNRQAVLEAFESDKSLQLSMQMVTNLGRRFAATGNYRLILSDRWLGLRYEKKWSSQVETSIRLLYPQFSRQVSRAFLGMLLLVLSLTPYVIVWWNIWALGVILLQFALAYYYVSHVWRRYRFIGALLWPLVLLQEIILIAVSVYRYNFGTVTWKGRPITLTNTK